MSVTICWRQINKNPKHFHSGTSTSLARLERAFGGMIMEADIDKLRAMAIAADDTFYEEVADLVSEVGDIEVWGEW